MGGKGCLSCTLGPYETHQRPADPGRESYESRVFSSVSVGASRSFLHRGIPGAKVRMGGIVVLRDRVGPDNHVNAVFFTEEPREVSDARAGWISDHHSGREEDDLCPVLLHLLGHVFDVSTGTPVAGGKPDKFNIPALVPFECTLLVAQRTEAFSPRTGPVAVTDDDSQLYCLSHPIFPFPITVCAMLASNAEIGLQYVPPGRPAPAGRALCIRPPHFHSPCHSIHTCR